MKEIVAFYGNEPDGAWAMSYAKDLTQKRAKRISKSITSQEEKEAKERASSGNQGISSSVADLSNTDNHSRRNLSKRSEEDKTSESSLDK
ncbi:hypothetical protein ANCCAN_04645 [Ancylostoma caninum]|uniref:Uncharacterized protein n=1 Tax=Ancylostoma caninum TaxID=29170 RepID=A0A368H1U1_ANCCA|nr:hypothetical protein ANCCAN_04645 [Ancylostoma caninum]